jgi:hypothetical protein
MRLIVLDTGTLGAPQQQSDDPGPQSRRDDYIEGVANGLPARDFPPV